MRKKTIDTIPVLSDNIKMYLLSLSRSRSLPESLVKRAKIILLASQGVSNQIISQKVGLHYNNVATWRNRFLQAIPFLMEIEAASPEKLEEEIRFLLRVRSVPERLVYLLPNKSLPLLTWPVNLHLISVMK